MAIVRVEAVLLLLDIRELRVTEARDTWVLEEHRREPFDASQYLLGALRPLAVAPALLGSSTFLPPRSAVLVDDEGFATVGSAGLAAERFACLADVARPFRIARLERLGILFVIVDGVDVREDVRTDVRKDGTR